MNIDLRVTPKFYLVGNLINMESMNNKDWLYVILNDITFVTKVELACVLTNA
jgi:hypothetical protein